MFFKKKKRTELSFHLIQAFKESKFLTSLMVVITIIVVLLLVINIKAIEYITALLVSKSVLDSMLSIDITDVAEILKHLGKDIPEETIQSVIDYVDLNLDANFYEEIIQRFFYDFVNCDGKDVSIKIIGVKLDLYTLSYSMIVNIFLVIILAYIDFIISGFIAQAYETQLKRKLINKLVDQDLDYFNTNKTGELISTIVKDSLIVTSFIKEAPIIFSLASVTILFSAIIMFTISWKLALCVFGLLAIFLLVILLTISILNKTTKKISILAQSWDNEISEKIYNIRLIKTMGTFDEEKKHFDEITKKVSGKKKKKTFGSEIPTALIVGGIGSFSMASIVFGVFLFYNQTQSLISIMTAFTTGVIIMSAPVMQLRQMIYEGPQARVSAENLSKILKSEILIDKFKDQKIEEDVENIKFKDIGFAYPESKEFVIRNFNLELKRGKKYAFVGPSGSGKSTISKLLLRFYETQEGSIIINDKFDLNELNLKSWLNKIGYVDQDPQILSGNIYDNVSYGLENKEKDEIIEACKKAKMHDLIMSWPEKYDTVLFERGAQLSGGQKQRLVIARLILKNPEILILDEATSALDNIVEKEIQAELEVLMENRTTISIAHRLSTIKNFDEIYVLEQNKGVVQKGNFEQLIEKEGLFKSLYQLSK